MCSGPRKPSPPPSLLTAPMDADPKNPSPAPAVALLLELSASDDVAALKRAVEIDGVDPDSSAPWYGRSVGPAVSPVRPMGTALRTPLSIAALYGSTNVLRYLLSLPSVNVNVNGRSTSDGATALHLAASGGAPNSLDAVNLLLSSSADVDALDSSNHRPGDVIAKHFSSSTARSLELILKSSSTSSSIPRLSSPDSPPKTPSEKKEYPPDLTLPDIKNGIYGTDEFRMYTFKVKPCSRAYSHDWTECPFVHPGENARRRDPRKYAYSCVPCPEFRKGSCRNGDNCEYAHGVFECWLHPAQYRTRLCKDEVGCNRRVCFFAHKPEELRSVNPTTASVSGLVLPSPRSSAAALGVSSLDMAAALMMMQQQQQQPGSPSASSGMGSASSWLSQSPAMSSSRLKSALSHRDFDLDLDLMGYQQKLLEEISGTASPRSNWATAAAAPASRAADYNDLFGSLDHASMLSQLSMIPTAAAGSATQFQTSQSISQQLLSGFGSTLPSSPTVSAAASSFGLDHSMAKAILNSRASAFAKRSHSFIDRSPVARPPTSLSSGLSATGTSPPRGLSNWGSPDGKLDWGVQGEELNKFRKSASFAFRGNQSAAPPPKAAALDEPDLSWVSSLVKDGPGAAGPVGQKQQQYQLNAAAEMFTPWEQLYGEQEQMVA